VGLYGFVAKMSVSAIRKRLHKPYQIFQLAEKSMVSAKFLTTRSHLHNTAKNCGSGLAREDCISVDKFSTDTTPLQASPLPQGYRMLKRLFHLALAPKY
jgi:hypothetical protein